MWILYQNISGNMNVPVGLFKPAFLMKSIVLLTRWKLNCLYIIYKQNYCFVNFYCVAYFNVHLLTPLIILHPALQPTSDVLQSSASVIMKL